MPRSPSPYAHGRSEIWGRGTLKRAISTEQQRLGNHVRTTREQKHLTQEEAAERIGIHPKHLGRIEGGTINLTLATLVAIAMGYGVTLANLFEEKVRSPKKR